MWQLIGLAILNEITLSENNFYCNRFLSTGLCKLELDGCYVNLSVRLSLHK